MAKKPEIFKNFPIYGLTESPAAQFFEVQVFVADLFLKWAFPQNYNKCPQDRFFRGAKLVVTHGCCVVVGGLCVFATYFDIVAWLSFWCPEGDLCRLVGSQ